MLTFFVLDPWNPQGVRSSRGVAAVTAAAKAMAGADGGGGGGGGKTTRDEDVELARRCAVQLGEVWERRLGLGKQARRLRLSLLLPPPAPAPPSLLRRTLKKKQQYGATAPPSAPSRPSRPGGSDGGDDGIGPLCRVSVQRWWREPFINVDADAPKGVRRIELAHPTPAAALASREWAGRLLFASSEADQRSPGVMEGAVSAAKAAVAALSAAKK